MSIYDFTVKDNKGNDVSLSEFEGKVLLIVNTATRCGLTPQYEGLEKLYEKYRDRAFSWRGKAVIKRNIEILNEAESLQ